MAPGGKNKKKQTAVGVASEAVSSDVAAKLPVRRAGSLRGDEVTRSSDGGFETPPSGNDGMQEESARQLTTAQFLQPLQQLQAQLEKRIEEQRHMSEESEQAAGQLSGPPQRRLLEASASMRFSNASFQSALDMVEAPSSPASLDQETESPEPSDFATPQQPATATETEDEGMQKTVKDAILEAACAGTLQAAVDQSVQDAGGKVVREGELVPEQQARAPYRLYTCIKDEFMYAYAKVGDTVICMKSKVSAAVQPALDAASERRAAAAAGLQAPTQAVLKRLETTKASARDNVVLVTTKATDAGLCVRAKVLDARDAAARQAMEGYARLVEAGRRVPVPLRLKQFVFYVQHCAKKGIVYCQDGCMHIYGTVDKSVMHVKVRAVRSYDLARQTAQETFERAALASERCNQRLKGNVTIIRGRVGDAVVCVKTEMNSQTRKALDTTERLVARINDLPITQAVCSRVHAASDSASDVAVSMKHGYLHIVQRVGSTVVHTRAKIVERGGVVKVTIVEMYTGTQTTVLQLADQMAQRALAAYGRTRDSALMLADITKTKALTAADLSKAYAAEKPVRTSAAGGAVIGGASGSAVGLTAGSLAGAAAGLPMALLTFGLSIPIGAVVGGTAGVCAGAVAGTAAGAVGGTAVGYGYERREQIQDGVSGAMSRAGQCREYIVDAAVASQEKVASRLLRRSTAAA
eukprot:TRINITY_DN3016_c0_g1_i10.p1 TRINITY_DN3016_c0_g1~~TRINITY_DN3016_c0_g1_i10.p1  ORF type:complete len:733 (+),score=213.12 TRINITY_DN3016_c0_g1_i10:117-2201(+)